MHARWTCVLRETYVQTRRYLKTFLTSLASIDFNPKQRRVSLAWFLRARALLRLIGLQPVHPAQRKAKTSRVSRSQPRQVAISGFVVCPHASFGVPQLCKKDAARWKRTRDGMRLSKAEHLGL
jgi:hypothetical protein